MDVAKIKDNLEWMWSSIKKSFENYEERIEQQEMVRSILNARYLGKHLLIEAGTGTGKSLAYIIAILAMRAAKPEGKAAIISTHTINLQTQLVEKDLPRILEIVGIDAKVVLAKGRGNYLCLNNIRNILNDLQGTFHSAEAALNFQELLNEVYTGTGLKVSDRSDIATKVMASVWAEVASSHESCLDETCPYIEQCLFKQSRKALEEADFIVCNHALLLADPVLRSRGEEEDFIGIFPPYDYLILDEAHNLESVATSAFSIVLDRDALQRPALAMRALWRRVVIREIWEEAGYSLAELSEIIMKYFAYSDRLLQQWQEALGEERNTDLLAGSIERGHMEVIDEILNAINAAENSPSTEGANKVELRKLRNSWEELYCNITFINTASAPDYTFYLDQNIDVSAIAAPLDISPLLKEYFFSKDIPVVATSATLAVPDMEYFAKQLGIDDYIGKIIASPFDYSRQARLIVPDYAIEPQLEDEKYDILLIQMLKEARERIPGGIFVLFTSYKMLNSVVSKLPTELLNESFIQGEAPREILLERFAEHGEGILLGTSSFWEGVDVMGDSLRTVIIARLPFSVPNDPLIAARMDRIKAQGGNSFRDYLLPQAVLRFKQGFGRLIRSKKDTGVIIVADKRIISKSYGKSFLRALPEIELTDKIENIEI